MTKTRSKDWVKRILSERTKKDRHSASWLRNRHIVIVANTTWNVYNFRLNVLDLLRQQGSQITVIAPVDEYIRYREWFPHVKHINLTQLDRDSTNPWQDLKLFRELVSIYREIRPDLVVHYTIKPNIYGGLAAAWCGVESIAVVTGLGYPFLHNGFIRSITKPLYWLSNRCHAQLIFENDDDRQLFVDKNLVSEGKSVSIRGCGVDTGFFYPVRTDSSEERLVFTYVGRLLYDKGIREFIEAAKRVTSRIAEVEFWILGEIDPNNPSAIKKEELVEWISEPQIHYLGSVKDVRKTINRSTCIVLPSYREGFSRVLMEAMALGKPIITTNVPGCKEAVEDGRNGFLVEPKSPQSLVQAILNMIDLDEVSRREMGLKGREMVKKNYEARDIAAEFIKIIESQMTGP